MKVLITGGLGFLGSNLVDEFASRGDDVAVLDNCSRVGALDNLEWLRERRDFQLVVGDVRSRDDVVHVMRSFGPDLVLHLAGQVAMTVSIAEPRRDFETNTLGTFNVLEAIRSEVPEARLIYSSTNKVYGDLAWVTYEEGATRFTAPDFPEGFDESVPLEFHSPYGCSKGAAEQYILDYGRIFDVRGMVFRHSSMYGGRQFPTFDQGWVSWFCKQALQQREGSTEPFTIAGSGKQVRDVLHADDMRRLYRLAAEAPEEAWGRPYNIGGGMANSLSLLELFTLLEGQLDVRLRFERLAERPSDQRIFVADASAAEKHLGWTAQVGASAGIADLLGWLRDSVADPADAAI